jgi:chloride channel 3/4/5
MNQLPYLDAKEEHVLTGSVLDVVDTIAPTISLSFDNTVDTLKEKLNIHQGLVTGFPIISEDDGGLRMQGYLGYDELERALLEHAEKTSNDVLPTPCSFRDTSARVQLKFGHEEHGESASAGSLDLGYLVDRAPMTVSSRAPLQL